MKKISLFTPCYNEEGNIRELYDRVVAIMETLPQYDFEYVFIDNCSTDRSPDILREIANNDKRVKVIFNTKNFGASRSGSYGFFQTTGDASICFGCDLQDPPELIPEFIKKWEEGAKLVWGQKEGSDENRLVYSIRRLYYKVNKLIASNEQYENVTGFGLYDREIMDLLRKYSGPTPNFRNMISEFGYPIEFIRYHQPARKWGHSSYNFFSYLNIALNDMVNTSKVPLRIATFFGMIVAMISFFIAIYYLVMKIVFWDSYNLGTATQTVGIFFLGGIQLVFIGVVGEYVGEILSRMNKRPMVVERERINFEESDNKERGNDEE